MTRLGPARQGHTRMAPAALRHAVEAVAADAFGVRRNDVSAALQDDAGKLGVNLLVRLPAPPLLVRAAVPMDSVDRAARDRDSPDGAAQDMAAPDRAVQDRERPALFEPVFERARTARRQIALLGGHITGMECGRISIRLAGAGHSPSEPRVDGEQDRRKA